MSYSAVPRVDPVTKRMHPDIEAALTTEVISPTAASAAASATVDRAKKAAVGFHLADYVTGTPTSHNAALAAACAAATAVCGQVILPPGDTIIDGTFSLSGYSCSIIGHGATAGSGNVAKGSVVKCINQTGPVLDFAGFSWPFNFVGRIRIEGFTVRGDGTAGSAKKGIDITSSGHGGFAIRDVTVYNTGGIALDVANAYLSTIDSVTLCNPINAKANDIPYGRFRGANGMMINGLGLRCLIPAVPTGQPSTDDVGVSGALRFEAAPSNAFMLHDTKVNGLWLENLHPGTDVALVVTQGNCLIFSDPQVFDISVPTGTTGSSIFRMEPSPIGDGGGNVIRGIIPGTAAGANEINWGVIVQQSGNSVDGVKGYRGANVRLDANVERCYVHLAGAYGNGGATGITDNSGKTTNTLIDTTLGTYKLATTSASVPAVIDLGNGVTLRAGAGDPNGVYAANPGSVYLRSDAPGSATSVYFKDVGTNNQGWHTHQAEHYVAASISSNFAINCATAHAINYTLQGSYTCTGFSNGRVGQTQIVMVTQDATGSRTVTWPAAIKWAGGAAPTLSTAAGKTDVFEFVFCNDGNWREMSRTIGA